MRALALVVVLSAAACGRRATTATTTTSPSTPPPATIDATVVGPDGPIAGARVRMLALPAAPCPCTESERDPTLHYGNEMPECACPAALAQWRTRLARCDLAAGLAGEVISGPRGHVRLEPAPSVTSLEAVGEGRLSWMRWPAASAPIVLALEEAHRPIIRISGAPRDAIRGAVLFDDGHCVPIDVDGHAWRPRVPIPGFELAGGTLLIEATGFATTVYSLFDQDEIDIELVAATPITGTCEGSTVKLENPFQRIVAKVDATQQFALHGAIAIDGTVTCWKDAQTVVEEWAYTPGEPLGGVFSGTGSFGGSCTDVMVVDAHDLPVADAEVSLMRPHGSGLSSGTSTSTDERGIACLESPSAGEELEITAPEGRCAGVTKVTLTQRHLAQSRIRVRLRITPLEGTTLRGRVIDSEGNPVVGASVAVKDLQPTNPDVCSDRLTAGVSGLDGTFSIPSLPRGKVVLEAGHKWFVTRELTVKHDGSAHVVVLPRGGRWTGRVLDPEGMPIDACSIFLTLADGRLLHTKCNAGAFDLKPIVAGRAELQVRLDGHALGTFRALHTKLVLDAIVQRADIRFPSGEHICGRVVDKAGHAIGRAQLAAIPQGAMRPSNRLHDEEVQVEADAAGNFTFLHMTPGTWTIKGVGRTHTQTTIDVKTGTTDATFVVAK